MVSHRSGQRDSKRESPLTEELTISCYGVGVRIVDAAGAELCQRLPSALAPDLRLLRADPETGPLPIAVVVAGPYQPGVVWRPTVVRGARAVLPLIDGTVKGREESARMLRIAAGLARGIVTLRAREPGLITMVCTRVQEERP